MKKRILAAMMAAVMVFSMAGCGSKADEKTDDTAKTEATDNKVSDEEETEIQVFIAASLKNVMGTRSTVQRRTSECKDHIQCRQFRYTSDTD